MSKQNKKMPQNKETVSKKRSGSWLFWTFILFAIALVIVAALMPVLKANETYMRSKKLKHDEVYDEFYNAAFEHAENEYHVHNEVSISLGEIRETANLRVLEVTDVEYIIENKEDNDNGITSWLEVPGKGFFTVDLQTSEFLVNEERKEVIVRIPEPVLSDFTIDYQNVNSINFHNSGANDSIAVGEDIARKQCREAYSELHAAFLSNPGYLESAKKSAEAVLKNLITQLNPEVPDLKVKIEYI